MAAKTGASLTALTVKVNDFVSVRAPSESTTVMVLEPFWFRAGDKERLQFGAVPDFTIPDPGRSVVFDEVTVIDVVQSGEESTSMKE
jgi:hypothetical protein